MRAKLSAADVKQARADFDMSQEEFAVQLGVVKSTICKWERGTCPCEGPMAAHVLAVIQSLRKS